MPKHYLGHCVCARRCWRTAACIVLGLSVGIGAEVPTLTRDRPMQREAPSFTTVDLEQTYKHTHEHHHVDYVVDPGNVMVSGNGTGLAWAGANLWGWPVAYSVHLQR